VLYGQDHGAHLKWPLNGQMDFVTQSAVERGKWRLTRHYEQPSQPHYFLGIANSDPPPEFCKTYPTGVHVAMTVYIDLSQCPTLQRLCFLPAQPLRNRRDRPQNSGNTSTLRSIITASETRNGGGP